MADETKNRPLDFAPQTAGVAASIQMAPLVDIVFLLICFFMLTTQLIAMQQDEAIDLPTMTAPVAQPQSPAEIVVNIRADGTLRANSAVVNLAELRDLLMHESERAAADAKPLRVVVRADRRQKFALLGKVMEACAEADIKSVIWRARHEDR